MKETHGPLKRKRDGKTRDDKTRDGKTRDDETSPAKKKKLFLRKLRTLQRETRCTTKTLLSFVKEIRPFLNFECAVPSGFRGIDSDLKRDTHSIALELNGCVNCNAHVFLPSDKAQRCPRCRFPRYSASGRANEVSKLVKLGLQNKNNTRPLH